MAKCSKIIKVVTILVVVITFICSLYIMYYKLGINDQLDFGAGAYYYADIPNFENYTKAHSATSIPYWIYLILYICWGWIMFILWRFIDKKK